MKKYTITDTEWEEVIVRVRELENESIKLKSYIEALEKKLTIKDVSQQRELLIAYNIDFYKGIHDVDLKHIEANVDKYLSKL